MNIDQKLKNIPRTKSCIELLQKEYNDYSVMLEGTKSSSETYKKIEEIMNHIYSDIQNELIEYKTILAAVKQLSDLKQTIIHSYYFDRKSLKKISKMMNCKYEFLCKTKRSAIKELENILLKNDCGDLLTE